MTAPSAAGDTTVTAPAGVLALYLLLMLAFVGGTRFLARSVYERPLRGFRALKDARGLLIVGAGDGGRLVLREILRNPELRLKPLGFVDDDPTKRRLRIDGVRVLGTTSELGRILDEAEPDEVTIAIPSAPGTLRAAVVRACRERGIPVRTLPTVFELLQTGGNFVKQVRDVQSRATSPSATSPARSCSTPSLRAPPSPRSATAASASRPRLRSTVRTSGSPGTSPSRRAASWSARRSGSNWPSKPSSSSRSIAATSRGSGIVWVRSRFV